VARDAEVASRDVGTLATRTPGVEDNIPDPIPEDDDDLPDPIPEEPTSAAQEPEPTESTENWRRATGPGGMSGVRAAARAARAADAASEGLGRAAGAAGRAARAAADEFGNMAGRAAQGFREEAGRAAEEAGRRAGSAGGVLRDVGKIAGADVLADEIFRGLNGGDSNGVPSYSSPVYINTMPSEQYYANEMALNGAPPGESNIFESQWQ
jgi:hypothetical protein